MLYSIHKMISLLQLRTFKRTDMDPKRKCAIRHPRYSGLQVIHQIYGMVCLNDEKKLSCKERLMWRKALLAVKLDIYLIASVDSWLQCFLYRNCYLLIPNTCNERGVKVYDNCAVCSSLRIFFVFFSYLDFTALSKIFHLYRADRSSKVGENQRTWGKTTWPSISRNLLSHMWPERGSNHSGEKPNGLRVNT